MEQEYSGGVEPTTVERLIEHLGDAVQADLSAEQPGRGMLSGRASRDEYGALLQRLYGWYAQADGALGSFPAIAVELARFGGELSTFMRSDLIASDLGVLGVQGIGLAEVPRVTRLSSLQSLSDALAILFVGTMWERNSSEVSEQMFGVWRVTATSGASFFDRSAVLLRGNFALLGRCIEEYCREPARYRELEQACERWMALLTEWVRNPLDGAYGGSQGDESQLTARDE